MSSIGVKTRAPAATVRSVTLLTGNIYQVVAGDFGYWAHACAANSSSRSTLNLCFILSSDSPTGATEGLNTHVHSEQPKPSNARSLTQTNLRGIAALHARNVEVCSIEQNIVCGLRHARVMYTFQHIARQTESTS